MGYVKCKGGPTDWLKELTMKCSACRGLAGVCFSETSEMPYVMCSECGIRSQKFLIKQRPGVIYIITGPNEVHHFSDEDRFDTDVI